MSNKRKLFFKDLKTEVFDENCCGSPKPVLFMQGNACEIQCCIYLPCFIAVYKRTAL